MCGGGGREKPGEPAGSGGGNGTAIDCGGRHCGACITCIRALWYGEGDGELSDLGTIDWETFLQRCENRCCLLRCRYVCLRPSFRTRICHNTQSTTYHLLPSLNLLGQAGQLPIRVSVVKDQIASISTSRTKSAPVVCCLRGWSRPTHRDGVGAVVYDNTMMTTLFINECVAFLWFIVTMLPPTTPLAEAGARKPCRKVFFSFFFFFFFFF